MPSSMSIERRRLLKALGADLFNSTRKGMNGAVDKAIELHETTLIHLFLNNLQMLQILRFIDLQLLKRY